MNQKERKAHLVAEKLSERMSETIIATMAPEDEEDDYCYRLGDMDFTLSSQLTNLIADGNEDVIKEVIATLRQVQDPGIQRIFIEGLDKLNGQH